MPRSKTSATQPTYTLLVAPPRDGGGSLRDLIKFYEELIATKKLEKVVTKLIEEDSSDNDTDELDEADKGKGNDIVDKLSLIAPLLSDEEVGKPLLAMIVARELGLSKEEMVALMLSMAASRARRVDGDGNYMAVIAKILEVFIDRTEKILEKLTERTEKPLVELQKELLRKEIEELKKKLEESRTDPISLIEYMLQLEERLRRLAPKTDPRIEIELAKLELEREKLEKMMELKKLELEMKLKKEEEKKRMLSDLLRRIADVLPNVVSGEQGGEELVPARCPKCGAIVTGKPGAIVKCPSCGAELRIPG